MSGRASFVLALFAVTLALGSGVALAVVYVPSEPGLSTATVERELREGVRGQWLEQLEGHCGLQVVIVEREARPGPHVRVSPVARDKLIAAGPLLWEELSRYPSEFFERAKIENLVLCEQLVRSDHAASGVADELAIFLDLSCATGPHLDDLRQVIHHEVFHTLDRERGTLLFDEAWSALNAPEFEYAKQTDEPGPGTHHDDVAGFVSRYARTDVGEDKAETFGYMMIRSAGLRHRAENDAVLERKLEAMQALVDEFCEGLEPPVSAELTGG
jgi:hypothetical protein